MRPCRCLFRNLLGKNFSTVISPRERAIYERAVIDRIGEIVEPVSQRSLNSIGAVRVSICNNSLDKIMLLAKNVKVGNDLAVNVDLDFFISGYPHEKEVPPLRT
jgi:hypothetical protein